MEQWDTGLSRPELYLELYYKHKHSGQTRGRHFSVLYLYKRPTVTAVAVMAMAATVPAQDIRLNSTHAYYLHIIGSHVVRHKLANLPCIIDDLAFRGPAVWLHARSPDTDARGRP